MTLGSVTSTGGAPASGGIDPTPSEPSTDRAASGFELLLAGARSETGPVVRDDRRGAAQPGAEHEPTHGHESESRDASETAGPDARGNDPTDTEHKPSATTDAPTGSPEPQPPTKPVPAADLSALLAALAALAGAPQPTTAAAATASADGGPDSPPVTDPGALPVPTTVVNLAVAALSLSSAPGAGPAVPVPPAPASGAHASDPTLAGPAGPAAGSGPVPRLDHTSPANASSVTDGTANATSTPTTVDSAGPPPSDRPRPPIPLAAAANGAATFAAAPAPTVTASADDATATAVAVAPPPPAEQLVSVLTPMRTTPNGSYTLRLELKPPELGRVEMRVEMRDGVLHASIHADHEGSAQLVRDALNELRDRLDAEGVQTGELTVSDGGVGSGSHGDRDASASAPASSVTAIAPTDDPGAASAIPPALPSDTTSLLDVRV